MLGYRFTNQLFSLGPRAPTIAPEAPSPGGDVGEAKPFPPSQSYDGHPKSPGAQGTYKSLFLALAKKQYENFTE